MLPKTPADHISNKLQFLSKFSLHNYAYIIREKRLKDEHIIALTELIYVLKEKESTPLFWENLVLLEAYHSIWES
ncbi:MAG: DNA mismatch repair protein MutS [Maribacter sp.]|jgi:DNA mismatch repair protein MutS